MLNYCRSGKRNGIKETFPSKEWEWAKKKHISSQIESKQINQKKPKEVWKLSTLS